MKKTLLFFLSFLIVSCSNEKKQSMTLAVNQSVRIPVEYVTITTGISERGDKATSVETTGYEKLSKVVNLLKQLGFNMKQLDINSGEVSDMDYGDSPYEYSASVHFKLKELDKIDTFRKALTDAGATSFQISSFNNSKEDSIYGAAYQEAISRAKRKAELLLKNQSLKVGEILSLNENTDEAVQVFETRQPPGPPPPAIKGYGNIQMVNPLFNKKYYTKDIDFTIEFALVAK